MLIDSNKMPVSTDNGNIPILKDIDSTQLAQKAVKNPHVYVALYFEVVGSPFHKYSALLSCRAGVNKARISFPRARRRIKNQQQ